ncbi:hypothetical protein ABPG75_001408 [Micractinium tetrahymenae]
MEDSSGPGLQLVHSLSAVVTFLHSEGFFAAEETLLREIENRYPAPDAVSPRHISASPASTGSGAAAAAASGGSVTAATPAVRRRQSTSSGAAPGSGAAEPSGDTVDFQPALAAAQSLTPVDSMESAEKVLEAWRSKSTTPAASPKKAAGLSPPASPASAYKAWQPHGGASSDADEYEDDDDPGFLRLDVVGQEAALGFELDQLSDTSGTREQPYYQLPQLTEQAAVPAHARHASIDMGLLNRHLHGGGSATSSQRGRSKAAVQQHGVQQQQQQQQQPVLLYEPVTSGQHWRSSSGQPLLPPGLASSASRDLGPDQPGRPDQQQQQQQRTRGAQDAQRTGSPASSEGGGSSFYSGELPGSPEKRSSAGHNRSSSYAQRQAGTAQWVFDRANSANSDAYRSLLSHLDRPSSGQLPDRAASTAPAQEQEQQLQQQQQQQQRQQHPDAGEQREQQQEQREMEERQRLLPPMLPRSAAQHAAVQQERQRQAEAAAGGASSPLFHQESISRVSSLGESMLQEAAAMCLQDTQQQQQQQQQQQDEEEGQPGGDLTAALVQGQAAPPAQQAAASQQQQQQQQQQQAAPVLEAPVQQALPEREQQQQQPAQEGQGTGAARTLQRPALPALRMLGAHLRDAGQGESVTARHLGSVSTAAAERGSDCPSPSGSAHTPDAASMIDYSDPFSFPVTPPSEVPPPPDPAPLFGSWASFKSSPDRKSTGFGGYGTEDESTPARRRYQQQAAVAAAAAAAAAKEQGGVQRSIKFPPLGPQGPGASGGGLLRGYGSSSQLLSYTTPARQLADDELLAAEFDQEYFDRKYEVLNLKIVHRRHCTGFEQNRELPLHIDDLIAGRYQIVDLLGQAAFSRAVQALDLKTGALVCLKIIKNNKDYFDQGLDEVKLLQYVNAADPHDESGLLRLYDFFYFKEHLVLVTELLRANLYEFQKYNRESGDEPYFTLPRMQSIARQVLTSLTFLHSLGLVHADLKPENILVKSYSRCQVKVIDLGSSCFVTDHLSSYVQSRSYRAPEVILGLPYDQKIDVWSLGCILAELSTGRVLFQNESIATLLARLEGILGPLPRWMLHRGRYAHKYFLRDGRIFEKNPHTGRYEFLRPKLTSLTRRVPQADEGMLAFLKYLLQVDPSKRPTAAEALQHPWLHQQFY